MMSRQLIDVGNWAVEAQKWVFATAVLCFLITYLPAVRVLCKNL
jgi:hypothetical protein